MTYQVVTGYAYSLDAREAAIQATQQALEQLGKKPVAFAIIVASFRFPFQQILSGITPLLGDTPLLGFSTTAAFLPDGIARRSITITLLSGNSIQARTDWWSDLEINDPDAVERVLQPFQINQSPGLLLVAADGLTKAAHNLCAALREGSYSLAGCLAAGDLRRAYTSQIGGKKSGRGGLAAGFLSGDIIVGMGHSHAWNPIGTYFTITRSSEFTIKTLDGQPANEKYAQLFGYTPQDWTTSPLNELARLYPLGIEKEGEATLLVRSPLRIEADGSLRMNAPVPEGSVGHLMVGGIEDCIKSAADASQQALAQLGAARPVLGLVFADISVQMLLDAQPGRDLEAIQTILGSQVPVIGGYTFGQIARNNSGTPELLNQHIMVIVLGEN
jgi:hypothetical protein